MISSDITMAFYNRYDRKDTILRMIIIFFLSIDSVILFLLVSQENGILLSFSLMFLAIIYLLRPKSSVISAVRVGKGQIEIVHYKTSFLSKFNKKNTSYVDRANAKAKLKKVGIFSPSHKIILSDGYHKSVNIIFRSHLSPNLQKWIETKLNCPSAQHSHTNYEKLRTIIPILPKKQIQEMEYRYSLFISLILALVIVTGAIMYF